MTGVLAGVFVAAMLVASALNSIALYWDKRLKAAYPPNYSIGHDNASRWQQMLPGVFGLAAMLRHRSKGGVVVWRYVIGEYMTALLLLFAFFQMGWTPELAVALWLTAILVITVHTDLSDMIIPNKVVLIGTIGMIGLRLASHPLPWHEYVIGAFAGSGALLLVAIIGRLLLKKDAMGGGDIKLYVMIGLALGWKLTLLSIFVASVFGFVGGLAAMLRGRHERGNTIPFGPYIAAAAIVVYYWGEEMLEGYMTLLLGA